MAKMTTVKTEEPEVKKSKLALLLEERKRLERNIENNKKQLERYEARLKEIDIATDYVNQQTEKFMFLFETLGNDKQTERLFFEKIAKVANELITENEELLTQTNTKGDEEDEELHAEEI